MQPTTLQIIGTAIFAIAVLHTFVVSKFQHIAHHHPEGSIGRNMFHFLGEVEAVFGMWALIFIAFYTVIEGFAKYDEAHVLIGGALHYLQTQNYTEPAFVFVIMCMAGTRPVIQLAEKIILLASKIIPLPGKISFYFAALVIGPILGSFITEPAAMTVTALILLENFYKQGMSEKFKYATIGLLFVNVSVGGTLTHFAAPPVLMVAGKWGWGMPFMVGHFGYKAAVACIISTLLFAFYFKKELVGELKAKANNPATPIWITCVHLLAMAIVVYTAHYMTFFLATFLFFLGFMKVTEQYQEKAKIKESLFVGFFLAGLVTLGSMQQWWLQEVITKMSDLVLYFGATALTAVTDNAALTYLGSLVELTDSAKYNLVAGAVTGGGLTVIANAPNPAGFGVLKDSFSGGNIGPLGLFIGALIPTLVVILAFQILPSL